MTAVSAKGAEPRRRRRRPRWRSLQVKFPAINLLLLLILMATVLSFFEFQELNRGKDELREKLQLVVESQVQILAESVWNLDVERTQLTVDSIITDIEVTGVGVFDETGNMFAGAGDVPVLASTQDLSLARDIVFTTGGQVENIGSLVVEYTHARLHARARDQIVLAGTLGIIVALGASLSAMLAFRRTVIRPVDSLLSAIERSERGEARQPVEWRSRDEMGQVVAAFNRMQEQQSAYENELEQRVAERTERLAVARDAAEDRERLLEESHDRARAQVELLKDLRHRLEHEAEVSAQVSTDLRQAREQLGEAIESISEGFALWDQADRLIMCNRRYRDLYPDLRHTLVEGARFEDFIRAACELEVFASNGSDLEAQIEERIIRHKTSVVPYEQELGNGRWVRVGKRKTNSGHTVGILSDVSKQRESEETIRRMAMEDPLTGLANRARFQEQLQSALDQATRTGKKVGVMLLDLDHFKNVNDTLGHAVGDELLIQVADRIRDCLRKTDSVARLGGDEFSVIVSNVDDFHDINLVGEKLIAALAKPFLLHDKEVHTGTSIGITVYPEDDGDQGQLLRNADLALYRAKAGGRGTCQVFDERMHRQVQARITLERDIRAALTEGQFFMAYQPQIDVRAGEVVGVEALIRWHHPERGIVPPSEFIPVAEETRQVIELSQWVLNNVCRQLSAWLRAGIDIPYVAVNLSPLQFRQEDLIDQVRTTLHNNGLEPHRLEIEITEGMAMAAGDDALGTLRGLKEMGVGLSIDDFGTGFSSLNRLKEFPVDRLKIDQSFIQNLSAHGKDAAICAAVVQLGHNLDLKVIAEGVETREQIRILEDLGCDEVQGFYISKPLLPADLEEFIGSFEADFGHDRDSVEASKQTQAKKPKIA